MDDKEIIELYWNRDEQAIVQTAIRYGKLCQQVALNIVGNRSDAEECVNDTYLRLWNRIPPERPLSLGSFISRITINIAIDRYRSTHSKGFNRELQVTLEELAEVLPDEPMSDPHADALKDLIHAFLRTLEETDRRLFLGRYWYAFPIKKLASAWGMTPNAVSLRLYKTRAKLKTFLTERGYKHE